MSTIIDTLIFNRTQSDVERVLLLKTKILKQGLSSLTSIEKSEYMAGMKGAYNYTDMNRVGNAVEYVANRMITAYNELKEYREQSGVADDPSYNLPYKPSDIKVTPKKNWTVQDIPTQAQVKKYLGNISNLRNRMNLPSTPPAPGSLDKMGIKTANDIEQILYDLDRELTKQVSIIHNRIMKASAGFVYTGMEYCGLI